MSDRDDESPYWSLEKVKSATRELVNAVLRDEWPRPFAMVDFGLKTQEHYESAYYALRSGEVSPAELDEAICSGPKLTELLRSAQSNPHKEIVFVTDWDSLTNHFEREHEHEHREAVHGPVDGDPAWDPEEVSPATRHLVSAMLLGGWPSASILATFGIASQEHYEAISYPLRSDEITPVDLDGARGNGLKLTELLRSAPSNPHREITFDISTDRTQSEGRTVESRAEQSASKIDRDIDRER